MTDPNYIVVTLENLEEAIEIASDGDTLSIHIDDGDPGLYEVHDHTREDGDYDRELRHVEDTRPVMLELMLAAKTERGEA